jgi:hypothetical protein
MKTIHMWGATGVNQLGETVTYRILFGFEPTQIEVHMALQHQLAFQVFVADKFPLYEVLPMGIPNTSVQDEKNTYVLMRNTEVQTPGMKGLILPAGTTIELQCHYELLFAPVGL